MCLFFWWEMRHSEAYRLTAEAYSLLCNLVFLSSSVRYTVVAGFCTGEQHTPESCKGDAVVSLTGTEFLEGLQDMQDYGLSCPSFYPFSSPAFV